MGNLLTRKQNVAFNKGVDLDAIFDQAVRDLLRRADIEKIWLAGYRACAAELLAECAARTKAGE